MCKKILIWSLLYQFMAVLILTYAVFGAETITLQWDENIPTPEGYRVFQRLLPDEFDYTNPVWTGTEITYTTPDLENGVYAWEVRAFKDGLESGSSNEVVYTIEPEPDTITYPTRPKQLIINFE